MENRFFCVITGLYHYIYVTFTLLQIKYGRVIDQKVGRAAEKFYFIFTTKIVRLSKRNSTRKQGVLSYGNSLESES